MEEQYKNTDSVIWFKSNLANGYSWLSNFWPTVPVESMVLIPDGIKNSTSGFGINGHHYLTVEHYYQSKKYEDNPDIFNDILSQPTALQALKVSKVYAQTNPIDANNWNKMHKNTMREALEAKFRQNDDLRKALLDTGDKELREIPDKYPSIWAWSEKTGNGLLGIILMEVRAALRD